MHADAIIVAYHGQLTQFVGESRVGKLLSLTDERTVVDEGDIGLVLTAIEIELEALGGAAVIVVGSHVCHPGDGPEHSRGECHVHQLVLVAQVLVFGVVGGLVVEACAQREAMPHVDAHTACQVVGVAVLPAQVGE